MAKNKIITDITCATCRALCCRLEVPLVHDSDDQVPEAYTEISEKKYTRMRQGKDGYCDALNRETMLCTIYEKRPYLCREYRAGDYDCMIERKKL